MNRDELNRIRRMGGVAQDFSAPTKEELTEAGGLGQYTGMGATTSGPDNHVHPKVSDSELDYEGDYDPDTETDFETDDEFKKGDHVKCRGEERVVVVADAKADFVGVAPLGQETDIEAIELVSAGELEKLEGEHDEHSDEEMDDEHHEENGDEEMGNEEDMTDEEMHESSHGRKRDTKVTPSLSRAQEKRDKKAMKSKERQQGKKEAMSEGFKKGDHVMCKGKKCIVKVPDGKADFVGVVPAGDPEAEVDMVRADELKMIKESMHYHSDNNYDTHVDNENQPVNVTAPYPTVWDDPDSEEEAEDHEMANDDEKVHVPASILSDLKAVITDCEGTAAKAEKRDDAERHHYYADTAKALALVHHHLERKTIEGLKSAQLVSQRMMNVSRALMPDHVWKFIVDGGTKRSLKDYLNDVKDMKYPIEGPRNTTDDNE